MIVAVTGRFRRAAEDWFCARPGAGLGVGPPPAGSGSAGIKDVPPCRHAAVRARDERGSQ